MVIFLFLIKIAIQENMKLVSITNPQIENDPTVPANNSINENNPLNKYFIKAANYEPTKRVAILRKESLEEFAKNTSNDKLDTISNPITYTNIPNQGNISLNQGNISLNQGNISLLKYVFKEGNQATLTNISNDDILQQSPLLVEKNINKQ